MEIKFDPKLLEYMKKRGQRTIAIEFVEVNNTDLEITELHVHIVNSRFREMLLTKKRYRSIETEGCELLLPPYPLKFEPVVSFGLKSFLGFHSVTYKGITV